jgi:fibronectin-binding autotransporter adhesin
MSILTPKCLHVSPRVIIGLTALLLSNLSSLNAQVFNVGTGTASWSSTASWNPATVPNATSASIAYFNAAGASNVVQTTSRTNSLDGPKTVGSISFNNDAANAFNTVINTGTGGPLTIDNGGAGATITVPVATGTGNFTISSTMTLADSLTVIVNDTTASSAAGALNLTGAINGVGGFTKQGPGLATFGTGVKTYTGPTVLSGGRMRMSSAASSTGTTNFTINAGAQLDLISAATFTFGSGPMNLNGAGATSGPYAAFPGAIRNDTGLIVTINNNIVLQSDTLLHIEGTNGSITFPNSVSGPGKLTLTAPNSSANQGTLILSGSNSYQGGTLIEGGTLVLNNAASTLGTGNVTVDNSLSVGSTAVLSILNGVTDGISDTATLSLAGGIGGTANLDAGVNETVGGLKLAGVSQPNGTYGSTTSPAANQNNTYFTGTGMITVAGVAPPPTPPTLSIVAASPNVVLSWPTNSVGFTLEQKSTVTSSTVWATNTTPVVVSGTNNTVTVGISTTPTFFRLIH